MDKIELIIADTSKLKDSNAWYLFGLEHSQNNNIRSTKHFLKHKIL